MSSASAFYGVPELAVYSATKHALSALTEALDLELEPRILVCDIQAPYVQTPMILAAVNVTGDGTMTFPEMVSSLGNKILPLPWWLISSLNNFSWVLRLSFMTKFPSPPLRMMVNPWIASSEKLKRKTDYIFKYDSRTAFMNFVKAVKKEK